MRCDAAVYAFEADAFRRAAQYFFMRTPTAFFCAAVIGLRRRATDASALAAAAGLPGPLRTMPGNARSIAASSVLSS